ncbi:MAG: alanine dehydrogenase [Desulfovibrionaceae bacterium]|nr:alanine dehydrogenase [Desulfovibrionaceae bacterium]
MRVGIPKEIKESEDRVAITPAGVKDLVNAGHQVLVEKDAGLGSLIRNEEYEAAGAVIVPSAAEAWAADLVLKIKEPISSEFRYLRPNMVLFTYLHLAAARDLADALIKAGTTAFAYETVQMPDRSLPLLAPMSEVAGRMAVLMGASYLAKNKGGKGMLLSGVPGVAPGRCVIVGGGQVGTNAAKVAVGLGAEVTVLDNNIERLRYLNDIFGSRIRTVASNSHNLAQEVKGADLLIGAVLIPGAVTPKLVSEEMVKSMGEGSVIVDVAVDQGGSVATIDRATTHSDPIYVKHGVVHYAVSNMPGAFPRTSTYALTNVTLPYALQLANKGWKQAARENHALALGLNTTGGYYVHKAVAHSLQGVSIALDEAIL